MQLDDLVVRGARRLVQVVDVLGNHSRSLAGVDQARDGEVTAVWLSSRPAGRAGEDPGPGFPALLGIVRELLEGDRLHPAPHPARTAEVRDARLGRYPGASENHDASCFRQKAGEVLGGLHGAHTSQRGQAAVS